MAKSEKVAIRVLQDDGEIVLHGRGPGGTARHYSVSNNIAEVDEDDVALVLVGVPGSNRARVTASRETPGSSKPDGPESKDGRTVNGSDTPN